MGGRVISELCVAIQNVVSKQPPLANQQASKYTGYGSANLNTYYTWSVRIEDELESSIVVAPLDA